MPQRTPEEKRQYMADYRARRKAQAIADDLAAQSISPPNAAIPGSDQGEAEIDRHTGRVIKEFDMTSVPGRIDAAFEIVKQDIEIEKEDQLAQSITDPDPKIVTPRRWRELAAEELDNEPIAHEDLPRHRKKKVEKIVDEPIFPKPDNKRGLPRSNYSFLDTPDLIKRIPQKVIDLILEKVNIHKGREPR